MGYAHYARIQKGKREVALAAVSAVSRDLTRLRDRGVLPPLAGPNGTGKPLLAAQEVAFNGVRPQEYETCFLGAQYDREGRPEDFYFTKTGRYPYDLAVMVAYLLWWHHSGGAVRISSDGYVADWRPALLLLEWELGLVIEPREVFGVRYFVLEEPESGLEVVAERWHTQPEDGPKVAADIRNLIDWALALEVELAPGRVSEPVIEVLETTRGRPLRYRSTIPAAPKSWERLANLWVRVRTQGPQVTA